MTRGTMAPFFHATNLVNPYIAARPPVSIHMLIFEVLCASSWKCPNTVPYGTDRKIGRDYPGAGSVSNGWTCAPKNSKTGVEK
jgi:hypothetical protein